MVEMASLSRVTRSVGSWEIRTWPYRFRLICHSHGGTGSGSAHNPLGNPGPAFKLRQREPTAISPRGVSS